MEVFDSYLVFIRLFYIHCGVRCNIEAINFFQGAYFAIVFWEPNFADIGIEWCLFVKISKIR